MTFALDHLAMPETLKVNGINCGGCKKPLQEALEAVGGIDIVSIGTKAESGQHPNDVVFSGDVEKVKAAIAELDAGRNKYTIEG